jgi:pimeloyl-ACP methyl ester carboxylesterase
MLRTVKTSHLSIGYLVDGPAHGHPVVLLHGWPDDALTWNRVVAGLHTAGYRTYAPYLRGFGPTRIELLAQVGHFPQREVPERVTGEIIAWLQRP